MAKTWTFGDLKIGKRLEHHCWPGGYPIYVYPVHLVKTGACMGFLTLGHGMWPSKSLSIFFKHHGDPLECQSKLTLEPPPAVESIESLVIPWLRLTLAG
jgi:hypothetical protein